MARLTQSIKHLTRLTSLGTRVLADVAVGTAFVQRPPTYTVPAFVVSVTANLLLAAGGGGGGWGYASGGGGGGHFNSGTVSMDVGTITQLQLAVVVLAALQI